METKQKNRTGTTQQKRTRTGASNKSAAQKQNRVRVQSASSTAQRRAASAQRRAASAQQTAAARQRTASSQQTAAAQARKRRTQPARQERKATPDVVYTPPKPFSRIRLLQRLATIVAVVLALTFGISIFFKVEHVMVSGTEMYSPWAVREASGIQEGDNLLTFGKAKAGGRIIAALPYVDDVRIGIKLPDTVNIEIVELDMAYAIKDQSNAWWLITSEGRVVEQVDAATAGDYTKILGVVLSLPVVNEQAEAMEPLTVATDAAGETLPVTVRASDQLAAAISILQYLEQNEVFGQVASVDVTYLDQLELWYGSQYQVRLGDTTQLAYKIESMCGAIDKLDSYQSGLLDVSYTTWEDQVGYTPF